MRKLALVAGAIFLAFAGWRAQAAPEIAVAIRYLKAEGVSHSQLYLFREDGTLLRQLTKEKSGQVTAPVFAPDGEHIIFKVQKGNATEYWSVEPKGGNLRKLRGAPAWYVASKESPWFAYPDQIDSGTSSAPERFTSPDKTQQLILNHDTQEEEEQMNYDTSQYGKHFQLRDVKADKTVELGTLEGFIGVYGPLHHSDHADDVFLIDSPLRVIFFYEHLNSTDGDTVLALDLNMMRFTKLSPNWATPVPLPGEAAFLALAGERYIDIPGSEKTANCSYVDYWDSNLKKVRYGSGTAAICYGASMYRPGKKPATITITDPNSGE